MHWGSSFFVLFCLIGLVVCLLPVRLQFHARHQQQWQGDFTIGLLGLHYTKIFSGQQEIVHKQNQQRAVQDVTRPSGHTILVPENAVRDAEEDFSAETRRSTDQERQQKRWRFQAHWRAIAKFFWRAGHAALRRLWLEQLTLRCNIGFQQPDRTAYSYALFWAVLSVLPPQWMEQADITYVPDFQRQRQDIELQGIIRASVGQVIVMILAWLWLVVQARLEQHRKEQIVYES